ncbi:protein AMBP-like isoform 2-T2 [Aulostomus maculatus]
MQRAASLVSVLVLQWSWILQVHPETLVVPQENFDLDQFMGRWYEVAAVSNCPLYMRNKRGDPAIVSLELKHAASQSNFTVTAASVSGSCKQKSTRYNLTDTSGKFFHHVARLGADVDTYVVHTDYSDSAMMVLLSTETSSGNKTTIVKLYSRNRDVKAAVPVDFRALVRQHGISDDIIIMNEDRGECVPGGDETQHTPQAQV